MDRLVYGLMYAVSLLPLRVLYGISSLAAFVLHRIVRYRKDTVMENVAQAFPHQSLTYRNKVAAGFYRHFTDNWVETIKLLSMPEAAFKKRITGNFEVFDELHKNGKTASMLAAHFFNWEWLSVALSHRQSLPYIGVYMPISSQPVDSLFKRIRGRFGAHLMPAPALAKAIIGWRNKQYLICLVADQSPSNPANAYWLNFLGRPTAFVTGPERNAQVFNQVPVYTRVTCPKRGYYHFEFTVLSLTNEEMQTKGELTKRLVRHIEADIQTHPETYLWSHRRWKHAWDASYQRIWIDDAAPAGISTQD
ncbi:lysophospholipid acyltransferase family protein [Phnomibacter sp. MR]|uniref:lysophospholipid acyltransferase family protein n=1 Tax=Phnomibacter sp. MR TaxID=3042318 RepID=UPI003A800057